MGAKTIIEHSLNLKKNEKLLIEASAACYPLVNELIHLATVLGALPFVRLYDSRIKRELIENCNKEQLVIMAENDKNLMEKMDAYIEITDYDNFYDLQDVKFDKMSLYRSQYFAPVHFDVRLKKKWVTIGYPSNTLAQRFKMSTSAFSKFYSNIMGMNYVEFGARMIPLKEIMDGTQKVSIIAPNTNLSFNIPKNSAVICNGKINLPDGEVFVGPVKESVNGYITFNTELLYRGIEFNNVYLKFNAGRIVEATAGNKTKKLLDILNTDEGAQFLGEFAIGTNPFITQQVKNIIYDEKMLGTIHVALGNSHSLSENGNKSAIHWDMVLDLNKNAGGGEICFDDTLIIKNGKFIPKNLMQLNKK